MPLLKMQFASKLTTPPGITADRAACSLYLQPILIAGVMRLEGSMHTRGKLEQQCRAHIARILGQAAANHRSHTPHRTEEAYDRVDCVNTHVDKRARSFFGDVGFLPMGIWTCYKGGRDS